MNHATVSLLFLCRSLCITTKYLAYHRHVCTLVRLGKGTREAVVYTLTPNLISVRRMAAGAPRSEPLRAEDKSVK